jgi:pSer/pThr/pTyr-binding forkhead associated (FHA) protein
MVVRAFHLVMQQGPTPGHTIELNTAEFVLGRDPGCEFVINDIEVSRRHARLIAQSGGYVIEDLGSTNGTFVEGERVRSVRPLKSGENIQLGESISLRYEAEPETSARDLSPLLKTPLWEELPEDPQPPKPAKQLPVEPPVETPQPGTPAPRVRERPRRQRMDWAQRLGRSKAPAGQVGEAMPLLRQPMFLLIGALVIFGACGLLAFMWYVDANFLWCDVFGNLIAGCRVP